MVDDEKKNVGEEQEIEEQEIEEQEEIEKPAIDDRIEELKAQELNKEEIVLKLYDEGYNTGHIMKRYGGTLKVVKKRRARSEAGVMGALEGGVKGSGYLEEFKNMIRAQISRSRELTAVFYNLGLGTLFASLHKTGMNIEDFRKIASTKGGLKEALQKAGETAFKALEYYESDLITRVEGERDEARAYASLLETQMNKLIKDLDPRVRLEKMIQTYLFAGKVEPDTLMTLIDKWLSMEAAEVKKELIA